VVFADLVHAGREVVQSMVPVFTYVTYVTFYQSMVPVFTYVTFYKRATGQQISHISEHRHH
jgi:hypothetical protein